VLVRASRSGPLARIRTARAISPPVCPATVGRMSVYVQAAKRRAERARAGDAENVAEIAGNKAVEGAAIAWVMDLERMPGRQP
jgi:hypothetical protein